MSILHPTRKFFYAGLACLTAMFPARSPAYVPREIVSYVEIRAAEPDFASLLKAYLWSERLDGRDFGSWKKRMRAAPWIPTLYAGYDHQIKRSESASVNDTTSISGGIVTVGPEENDYDFDNGLGRAVHVRAVWDLSEAVFSRHEFAAVSARQRETQLRSGAEAELYKIYEARHLQLAQYFMARGTHHSKAAAAYARYLELTDRLDALTGRAFTGRFWTENRRMEGVPAGRKQVKKTAKEES